jgi:hypothetical protein
VKHPPVRNEYEPLGNQRVAIAVVALVILIVCFTPAPLFVLTVGAAGPGPATISEARSEGRGGVRAPDRTVSALRDRRRRRGDDAPCRHVDRRGGKFGRTARMHVSFLAVLGDIQSGALLVDPARNGVTRPIAFSRTKLRTPL